jgi:hypothetical protein
LEAERGLREALEGQLGELATQLAALRDAVPGAYGAHLARTEEPAVRPRPATRLIELPRGDAWSQSYWLRRCEGFLVEVDKHSLGSVDALHFERHHDRPDALIVAVDGRRHRLCFVSVEDIAEISPENERIILSHDPREPRPEHRGVELLRTLARILRQAGSRPTEAAESPEAGDGLQAGRLAP